MFPSWVFSRLTSWYAHHVDQLPHKKYYRRMNLPYYNIHVGLCFLLLLFHQIQVLHLHLLKSWLVINMTSSTVGLGGQSKLTSDFFLIGRDFKIFKQFFSNSFKFGIGWFEIEIFLELGWRRWFTTSLNFFITNQNEKKMYYLILVVSIWKVSLVILIGAAVVIILSIALVIVTSIALK